MKSQFVAATGAGFMDKLLVINRSPMEMRLPGHNFTGPEIKLSKRLHPESLVKPH